MVLAVLRGSVPGGSSFDAVNLTGICAWRVSWTHSSLPNPWRWACRTGWPSLPACAPWLPRSGAGQRGH